jgi:IS30 family transposase
MGQAYKHFDLEERCAIARLHEGGQSLRQIAAALDRAPSSISRELKRNRGVQVGYKPSYAQDQAAARRWSGSRLENDPILQNIVLGCLSCGWSPEQVAGWLRRQRPSVMTSYESIYRFIYAQMRRTQDGAWRYYLPRAKFKRGRRGQRGGSPASFIQGRVPISKRPKSAASRRQAGHWEADLMLFAAYGQSILVAHERKSRVLIITKQPNKRAKTTADQLLDWLEPLDPRYRKTLAFDNGTEFAEHYRLNQQLGMQTFFCDTHSPWQKGGVENAIGRMRRNLPRKTNLAHISPKQINQFAAAYNNTPRKCLGFKTPAEVFNNQVLHFECESTCRPAPA